MPVKDEIPIEAADLDGLDSGAVELERVVVDDLDERDGRDVLVARDRVDKRLEPALGALAMAVEEDEYFSCGYGRALKTRSDEAFALRCSN